MNQYKSIFKLTAYIVSLLLVSFHIGYVLTYMTLSIDTIFLIMYFIFFILISSNTPESKKTTEMSLIFSMVPLGSFVGSCFSQFPLRYLTRKQSLLIADFIGLLSFFTLIPNRECIIIFRFFFGFSNGLSSVLMPTFLKEVCPSQLYAQYSMLIEFLVTVGILFGQIMGMGYLGSDDFYYGKDSHWWQLVFAVPGLVYLTRIIAMTCIFPYDSPLSLIKLNKLEEARKSEQEVIMKNYQDQYQKSIDSKQKFSDLLSKRYLRRVFIGIILMMAQQWTGIFAIYYYSGQIFSKLTNDNKVLNSVFTLLVGVFKLISSFLSIPVVNMFGRKQIVNYGSLIIMIMNIIIAVSSLYQSTVSLVIIAIAIYSSVFVFGLTLGPICWSLAAELNNSDGTWVSLLARWTWQMTTIFLFPFIVEAIDIFGAFLIYAFVSFLSIFNGVFLIRETKGKSQLEIDDIYLNRVNKVYSNVQQTEQHTDNNLD